jgi:hypothetical protein
VNNKKVNTKLTLHKPWRYAEDWMYRSTRFLTSALNRKCGQPHAPAASPSLQKLPTTLWTGGLMSGLHRFSRCLGAYSRRQMTDIKPDIRWGATYMSRSTKFVFQSYLSPGICVPLLNGNNRATENKEKFCENITGIYWLATR